MITVFLCSPHAGGVTDRLGSVFASACQGRLVSLRDYAVAPCRGCGFCLKSGGECVLPRDGAEDIFAILGESTAAAFVAPVYFYALPAHFKALIDRSQRFWALPMPEWPAKKAAVIMAAGRSKGQKLFDGSMLTLKCFLLPFGMRITDTALMRGLDTTADLEAHPEYWRQMAETGAAFG